MAQAPDAGGGGAPRQNKTVKEFAGMNTQNERNAIPPGAFHWLENIQPIGPGHLHSIPGRSLSLVRIPPDIPPPPAECTDITTRGQQLIVIETAFDQATTFGGGNLRTSWGFINDGALYSLIGLSGCAGGSMAYTNTCCQINHFKDDNPTLFEALTLPTEDPIAPFINTRIGTADQPIWAAVSNAYNGLRIYYDLGATFVDYVTPSINFGGHDIESYAVEGDEVWIKPALFLDSGPPNTELAVYDRATGTKLHDYFTFGTDNVTISNMQLTASFLYALGSVSGVQRVYKIDRSDGSIVDSLIVTALGVQFLAVADDNLLYLLCSGTPASMFYVENFADPFYVGYTPGQGFVPFGLGTGIWNNGTFYYGSNGFGGFTTDVFKIVIPCASPVDAPMFPTLVAEGSPATVVAGSDITITWGDILLPHNDDQILIKPAPAAGVFGLAGATIASFTNVAALNAGSTPITIPGGTTPGNYVAMYAAVGTVWAQTSNVFTVT